MWLLDFAADSRSRAVAGALCAALALLRVDDIVEESLADACRASLVNDMSNILISEVFESRENRVRCCLTESAESVGLNVLGQLFESVEVFEFASAL